jgi:hypothetical protein
VPPQVTQQQQGGALQQYAGAQMAGGGDAQQQKPSMKLADDLLKEAAGALDKLATVLQQEMPAQIPIVKQIVQGMVMLQQGIEKGMKAQMQQQAGPQQQQPNDAAQMDTSQGPQGSGAGVTALGMAA